MKSNLKSQPEGGGGGGGERERAGEGEVVASFENTSIMFTDRTSEYFKILSMFSFSIASDKKGCK